MPGCAEDFLNYYVRILFRIIQMLRINQLFKTYPIHSSSHELQPPYEERGMRFPASTVALGKSR